LSDSCDDFISEASSSHDAAAGLAGALKVVGRRSRLFDRPGREDIRRVAVWDMGLHERTILYSSASGSSERAQLLTACGLSEHEVIELLYREITPEDYELLLRLDELNAKKTASAEMLKDKLTAAPVGSRRHDTCGVCLMPFEEGEDEDVVAVPCPAAHEFHRVCVTKWLTQCKNTCPVDHAELWPEAS